MKFGKMKPQRRNRLMVVGLLVVSAGVAVTLALSALNENLNLYYSPAQIVNGEAPTDTVIRAGGMVVNNSIKRSTTDLGVQFVVSDMHEAEVTIAYVGILPDLFREGQGVIARGQLNGQGVFIAEEVLAKHDETYMPPEIAQTLARSREAADAAAKGATL
jgi:cytochrome c-type biogenesis protein CcmE